MSRTYVDNAMNRRLGRVGLPLGSAVHSSSGSSSSSSSPRRYVDNAMNRRLGRVGMLHGTAVHSKYDDSVSYSPPVYVDYPAPQIAVPRTIVNFLPTSPSSSASTAYGDSSACQYRGSAADSRSSRDNSELVRRLDVIHVNTVCPTVKVVASAEKKQPDYVLEEIEYLKNLKLARNDVLAKKSSKIELKSEKIIAFNELTIGEKIGMGGFADVHVASWKGQRVAVKKLRVQRVHQAKKKQFEAEARSIADLDHPNVVKFYGACIVTPNLALVMEFLPDGSLYDSLYLDEDEETMFEDDTKNRFICDSFSALKYVHSKNMAHRDIKSKNIMLYDGKNRCKLADFGLALKDDVETTSTVQAGFAGTVKYCPKEVLEGNRLTIEELKLADVYSLALTSFELLTEREPFDECKNVHQIRKAIVDGEILKTLALEKDISTAVKELLKSALSPSQYRPSAAQISTRFSKIVAEKNKI